MATFSFVVNIDVVRMLECDKGQGYFFSWPLVSEDLVSWVLNRQARSEVPPVDAPDRRSGVVVAPHA